MTRSSRRRPWYRRLMVGVALTVLVLAAPAGADDVVTVKAVSWTRSSSLTVNHIDAATALVGGRWYLFGAYFGVNPVRYTQRVDVFDLATKRWGSASRAMPEAVSHAGVAVVDDRYVYLAGGFRPNRSLVCNVTPVCERYGSTNVWRYDTQTDRYALAPPLPEPRGSGSLALVGRTLHFVSGVGSDRLERVDHWTLDLDNGSRWVASTPLPPGTGRNHFGLVTVGTMLFAVGGQQGLAVDNDVRLLSSVLAFDTANPDAGWVRKADLPAARSHTAQTTLTFGCVILIAGGDNPANTGTSTLWQYVPTSDTWSAVGSGLPDARFGAALQTDGTALYYAGGSPTSTGRSTQIGRVTLGREATA